MRATMIRLTEMLRHVRWLWSLTPGRLFAVEGLVLGAMTRCDCGRLASQMVKYEQDGECKWAHLCSQCPVPPVPLDVIDYGNLAAIEVANRQGL